MPKNDVISLLIFGGVLAFIFALKTSEAPWWFLFYSIVSAFTLALAVKLLLT